MNTTSDSVNSALLAAPYQLNIYFGLFIWLIGNIGCIGNIIVFSSRTLCKRAYSVYLLWEALSDLIYFNFLLMTRVLQKGFQIPITTRYDIICKLRQFDSVWNHDVSLSLFSFATIDRILSAQRLNTMGTPLVMFVLAFLLIRSVRSVIRRRIAPSNNKPSAIIVQRSILQQIDSRLTLMLILQLIIAIVTRIPYAAQLIYTNITKNWSKPCTPHTHGKHTSIYDYIVVGSGPGGTTIATRLALNNFKVLLIEAGPDYDDSTTRIAAFWPLALLNPKITGHFHPYLFSKADHVIIDYPRGITLGGSAQINTMIAITPNPLEWDYIAQITGDYNWSSKMIKRKYLKLTENCQYCTNSDNDKNKNGWLNISIAAYQDPLPLCQSNPVLYDLLENIKTQYEFNPNINYKSFYDSYFFPTESVTKETGTRGNTYRHIKNVQSMKKSNLYVWTNTFVTKLIIDPRTKEACGVEYIKGSYLYHASPLSSSSANSNNLRKLSIYAKREIIVSGGQWMTPQLLQLSGIGDRNLLRQFGIRTIQHLPGVGVNQQDRSEATYVVKLKDGVNMAGIRNVNCTFNSTPDDPCLIDYIANPRTSFYSNNRVISMMIHSTQPIQPNFPDTAYVFIPSRFTGFRENWVQEALQYPAGSYLSVIVNLAHGTNNLGSVRIQSTNAFETPLIQINHFAGPIGQIELNRIKQSFRYLRNLILNSSFSKYVDYEELPGINIQTDEELEQFIRKYIWSHHACCTAKMGNTSRDPLAVLNSKGQVKGIKNLRVCDISIFPKIPSYFPLMPIITACEKIADDIIKRAKY
ncbi:unnamed protein product [Rotaria sordida]|uniref:Choline dehydrogenase n=1 Tax=Rotaria sordida TaxID=392033 RepID=A0A815AWJ5_9BILA|nr:unnamed protein product [Rotaria sordida]